MRRTFFSTLILASLAVTASAQTAASTPATLRLTVEDAVKMALEHNVDLNADRLDPQISDTRVAAAAGVLAAVCADAVAASPAKMRAVKNVLRIKTSCTAIAVVSAFRRTCASG